MTTTTYDKVKRMAALALFGVAMMPSIYAQESLHLFYKDGKHERIEITPNTKVEFYKKPYLVETTYTQSGDTIHLSSGAGRTWGIGHVHSNVAWKISVDSDWLYVRQNKMEKHQWLIGDGMVETSFLIFAEANETDKERTAKLSINTTRDVSKEITVIQHPYQLSLEPVGEYWGFEPMLNLEATLAWNDTAYYAIAYPNYGVKVLSHPNWMSLDAVIHGADNFSLDKVAAVPDSVPVTLENINSSYSYARFRFAANESPNDRKGNIILEGYGQTAVVTVTQKGLTEEAIVGEAKVLAKQMYQYDVMGGSKHNDFGFPSIMLGMDCRGTDLVSENTGYNWYSDWMEYDDLKSNYYYTYMLWKSLYDCILIANQGIESYKEREDESLFQFYLGQAYTLRAFNYFYLAQLYQQTYVGNEDLPCVPIVTESNMNAVYTKGRARATVREVYDFILADLDKAQHLLQQTAVARPGKQFVTPEVVCGLRARIYMVMNRWEEAAANAQRVIEESVAMPYTIEEVGRPTFNDINHNAWLWGIDTEETDRVVTTGICNWPSHMGSLNYGYASVGAWRMISKRLYAAIPTTDVRKGWFLNESGVSANLNADQAAHIASVGCPAYTQVKFAPYLDEIYTSTNANDIPLMRVEEMYLILAEAQAWMGDVTASAATLQNFVSKYRDPAYTCVAYNIMEMVEAVWIQRRIELWGEGHSYFDLMRMKKGVDRRGAGFQTAYVFNIPAGDAALIYPIPDREMNNNPALVQNPVATQPIPIAE